MRGGDGREIREGMGRRGREEGEDPRKKSCNVLPSLGKILRILIISYQNMIRLGRSFEFFSREKIGGGSSRWKGEEGGMTIVIGNTLVKERRKNLIPQIVHTSCPSKTLWVSPLPMYNL